MIREPRKALKVNYEPCHGVVAYLKERDRPKQSMASITGFGGRRSNPHRKSFTHAKPKPMPRFLRCRDPNVLEFPDEIRGQHWTAYLSPPVPQ